MCALLSFTSFHCVFKLQQAPIEQEAVANSSEAAVSNSNHAWAPDTTASGGLMMVSMPIML
jgi:hypothetical protein